MYVMFFKIIIETLEIFILLCYMYSGYYLAIAYNYGSKTEISSRIMNILRQEHIVKLYF